MRYKLKTLIVKSKALCIFRANVCNNITPLDRIFSLLVYGKVQIKKYTCYKCNLDYLIWFINNIKVRIYVYVGSNLAAAEVLYLNYIHKDQCLQKKYILTFCRSATNL